MVHLKSVQKKIVPPDLTNTFPFNTNTIKLLDRISFTQPVTFFVGENGSGKSTLLEGIAAGCRLPTVGSHNLDDDETLRSASELAKYLQLSWLIKTNKGFFLRAEDFFGFTKQLNHMRSELEEEIKRQDEELPDGYGKDLAIGALKGQITGLTERYGVDLNANSHGESFLKLFQSRLKPNSLYILDEPETPLSPTRQMSLLVLMNEMVKKECQFIVATHSPILMAFPDADIFQFSKAGVQSVCYEDVEHVQILTNFLNHKEKYLKELL